MKECADSVDGSVISISSLDSVSMIECDRKRAISSVVRYGAYSHPPHWMMLWIESDPLGDILVAMAKLRRPIIKFVAELLNMNRGIEPLIEESRQS
jgi:hypothetical protein